LRTDYSLRGQIEKIYSLPLGAVRLTGSFLPHDPAKKRELQQLKAFIEEEVGRVVPELTASRVRLTVATSGTPAALADMWSARVGSASTPFRERIDRADRAIGKDDSRSAPGDEGNRPRRSEIIVAGAMVFSELLTRLHLRSSLLALGLRDGILSQMMSEYDVSPGIRKRIASEAKTRGQDDGALRR